MDRGRFKHITGRYPGLRIGVLGDFCLDRYLEIDPARSEVSIETGLPVHNVVRVRPQPGAAGTILNNLCALGVGRLYPIGFAGEDGEGYELGRALAAAPGVDLRHFVRTPLRRTFTYCKPLVCEPNQPPRELNRLDTKNWDPTPVALQEELGQRLRSLAPELDALIVLDQVDLAETGVVTGRVLQAVEQVAKEHPALVILADSRRGLQGFPPVIYKMNASELAAFSGGQRLEEEQVKAAAVGLAKQNGRLVFVTLSERGILGADPKGGCILAPAFPVRGEIDVVGAGDSVSANLVAALAAGAALAEALALANAAASVVVHKLGTTGTASPAEIAELLGTGPA